MNAIRTARRRSPSWVLPLLLGLALGAGCGSGEDAPASDARYQVTIETDTSGERPRLVLEVRPKEPWLFDMDSLSEVALADAPAQPASRISARRILFEAFPGKAPAVGQLRFSICRDGACEPVEHGFQVR